MVLEEALDLSSDRLLMMMMTNIKISLPVVLFFFCINCGKKERVNLIHASKKVLITVTGTFLSRELSSI
jgi:hypothetical protein